MRANVNESGMIIIGLSGILCPVFVSAVIHPHGFYMWYGAFTMKMIALLSMIISIITVILDALGFAGENEDITKVLHYWKNGSIYLLLIFALAGLIIIRSIIKADPINRIYREFKIKRRRQD